MSNPETKESLYQRLLSQVNKAEALHAEGVPVYVFDSLAPRSDNMSVFDEGEMLSGKLRKGNAEASVTVVASPHMSSTVPTKEMIRIASETFQVESHLPKTMYDVEELPPELMI